ncbi:MAG: DUF4384 domain-containing protein [Armatimonadetes bacterium]|nr:DUF4384 domain-containing protein [Armatimonadota bacterium]
MRWSAAAACLILTSALADPPVALNAPILDIHGDVVVFGCDDLAPGTVVELYAPDDKELAGPVVARVQVVEVRDSKAIGRRLSGAVERGVRPRTVARPLPVSRLRVRLTKLPDERGVRPRIVASALDLVRAALARRPGVRLVEGEDPADAILAVGSAEEGIRMRLTSPDGAMLAEATAAEADPALDRVLPSLDRQAARKRLAELANPAPPFQLTLRDPRGEAPLYHYGEAMQLEVTASQACHVVLLALGSEGRLTILLPNALRPSTAVTAGETVALPDPAWGFKFQAGPPTGEQLIKAVATRRPLDLPELRCDDLGERRFRRLEPAEVAGFLERLGKALVTSRVRDFDVVADDAWVAGEVRVRIAE